jgi:3-carboxy-cis,cis-muconate cycloisomerase
MADLFWPGDERARSAFDQRSFLEAMVEVEAVWLGALHRAGVAAGVDEHVVRTLVRPRDLGSIAESAEASGNPVVPLVALLRERLTARDEGAARWLHRGLTSQDVLDTALVLCARAGARQLLAEADRLVEALAGLAHRHREDLMAGRTLTQHAVPITFGLKAAQWLHGILDARDDLRALRFPVQVGGAAGTLAAVTELVGDAGTARSLVSQTARGLRLDDALPWHTSRAPFTRYADALVRTSDALGHIANDVLLLARPEIAELAEPAVEGRGGSSTMPQKANPVLSVLIRRAALSAPGHAAQLHLAAAATVDERPDGSWHTEWTELAGLTRHTLTAASQAAEVIEGLHVDTGRMAAVVKQQSSALLAEQRSIAALREDDDAHEPDFDPAHYLGAADSVIDQVLVRARTPHPPGQAREQEQQ